MGRNGSGTYTLPEAPFVPNTAILSAEVNSDFDDIADALTGSVAADGQTLMTGGLAAFAGTLALPGLAWAVDLNTGRFRSASDEMQDVCGGVLVVTYTTTGINIAGILSVATISSTTLTITGNGTIGGTLGVTGNLAVNTNKFTVTASNGNTTVAGTFAVTGATTAAAISGTSITASAALSGATAAGGMVATQADMESASATDKLVTPGRTQYHPGVAKGWVKAGFGGTFLAGFNVSSISDGGIGLMTVNWTTSFSGADYAVVATPLDASTPLIAVVTAQATGSVTIQVRNSTTGAATDGTNLLVVAFGDQ